MIKDKRFDVVHSPVTDLFVVNDNNHKEVFEGIGSYGNACRFANCLNELSEGNWEHKKKVKNILQKYFDEYTRMAVELRHDKYGNGVCHDVTEVLCEIADKLDIKLDYEIYLYDDPNYE